MATAPASLTVGLRINGWTIAAPEDRSWAEAEQGLDAEVS
jgi:hypothetical protein